METKTKPNEHELSYFDVLFRHKNTPCVVCGHGRSLNNYRELIEVLQVKKKIVRMSVNNWWDFFSIAPDYMTIANPEGNLSIKSLCPRLNALGTTTLFYADSVDVTPRSFGQQNAKFDYMGYDQRHFRQQDCTTIYNDFLTYQKTHPNTDFKNFLIYGSPTQWTDRGPYYGFWPRIDDKRIFPDCCANIRDRLTVQEQLQRVSGHAIHYSPGDSGAFHAISFAVLMGCNPIYLVGIDLDYRRGYATTITGGSAGSPPGGMLDPQRASIDQDLTIIKESAQLLNIKIYDLSNCEFNVFEKKEDILI